MTIEEFVPLQDKMTFRMGPIARYFVSVSDPNDLKEAVRLAKGKSIPFYILGGGSNIIFTKSGVLEALIIKIDIFKKELILENDMHAVYRFGAGEVWDEVVEFSVNKNLSGIEAMSFIPGTVGGTPIQNVGAYGQEVKDTIFAVEVYDVVDEEFKTLTNKECEFSYRDSIFKKENRYIVTEVILKLSKTAPQIPNYPGVKSYFEAKGISLPTISSIREAIIEIRKNKLPDPKEIASVGSFFKNPIIDETTAMKIKEKYEKPVLFDLGEGKYKVGAGWLIDTLGIKGKTFGNLSIYKNNALVIVNNGEATYEELILLVRKIEEDVFKATGIQIEPEPVFI